MTGRRKQGVSIGEALDRSAVGRALDAGDVERAALLLLLVALEATACGDIDDVIDLLAGEARDDGDA